MKTLIHALLLTTALGVWAAGPDFDDPGTLNKILREGLAVENIQERDKDGVILIYAGDSRRPYTGWIKAMGPGGQIASLFHCEDGLLHGPWTQWHSRNSRENNKESQTWKLDKAVLGEYQGGEKEGLWTEWEWGNSESGSEKRKRKASEGRYQNGKKEGSWSEPCGVVHSPSFDAEFVRISEGKAYRWFDSRYGGARRGVREGLYRNGKKQGPWIIVPDSRSEPQEVLYKDGALNGFVLTGTDDRSGTFRPNDREGIYYKDGKIEGIQTMTEFRGLEKGESVYKSGKLLLARYQWHGEWYEGSTLDEILGERSGIPAAFHGMWKPGPRGTDNYMEISSSGIRVHEAGYAPITVEIFERGRVMGMRFTGIGWAEGEIMSAHMEFRLSPDGKTLSDGGQSFRRGLPPF